MARAARTLFIVLATLSGCGPKGPTEPEARAALTRRSEQLKALQANIEATVAELGPNRAEFSYRLPRWAETLGALGISLRLRRPAAGANDYELMLELPPCPPGTKRGGVAPADGIRVGDFALGWGQYQTAWGDPQRGDEKYHPGIQVAWSFPVGTLEAQLLVCYLTDGALRPPYGVLRSPDAGR